MIGILPVTVISVTLPVIMGVDSNVIGAVWDSPVVPVLTVTL